jgi:hypothetical protein
VTSRFVGALGALAPLLAACGGDDVTFAPPVAPRHGAPIDATIPAFLPDAAPHDAPAGDGTTDAPSDAAREPCTHLGDAGAPDVELDAGSEGSTDAGACVPRVLGRVDFDRDPPIVWGGRTPGALAVGHAGKFLGPDLDRSGAPGACFLASHPGAVYGNDEDAWAELAPFDLRPAAGCAVTLHAWVWYELQDSFDGANLVVFPTGATAAQELGAADGPSLYEVDDFAEPACGVIETCPILGQSAWSSFAAGSTTWREATFDLSSFAGDAALRLRLQFHTDSAQTYQGIYVQDVLVTSP